MPSERAVWIALFALCVGSRLASTIFYIEDPDSLRFALSMVDYDVARLNPHFPAYPVFCFVAKGIYLILGSYAVAFSLVGGLSTFLLTYSALSYARLSVKSPEGAATTVLLLLNPLMWLMANRYMPDLMGVACVVAVYALTAASDHRKAALGFMLAGLLCGVRLSYAPIVLPPLLFRMTAAGSRYQLALAGTVGLAAWLLPLIAITGWGELIAAAQIQSTGHFGDFGGTIATEPDIAERLVRLAESIWADGFGLYWWERHPVTAVPVLALLVLVATGCRSLPRATLADLWLVPVLGCLLYLVWVFVFQNVIHKSRHILPLLPFLSLALGLAAGALRRRCRPLLRLGLTLCAVTYGYVTLHLIVQHAYPSAIAQVFDHLKSREQDNLHVVATPLIEYYLSARGLQATYAPVETPADLEAVSRIDMPGRLVSVGSRLGDRATVRTFAFYHNPYVNRMWSELVLYEY